MLQRRPWWRLQSSTLDQQSHEAEAEAEAGGDVGEAKLSGGTSAKRRRNLTKEKQSQFHFHTSAHYSKEVDGWDGGGGVVLLESPRLCPMYIEFVEMTSSEPVNHLQPNFVLCCSITS